MVTELAGDNLESWQELELDVWQSDVYGRNDLISKTEAELSPINIDSYWK
jgi:hypothetical protein